MNKRIALVVVLILAVVAVSAASVIRPHTYLNNPDMLIAGIETENSITAGESSDVTIMINVTNGEGTDGLGTWSPSIDLWSVGSPAAGPDISAWTENDMLTASFLCGASGDFDGDLDVDFVAGSDLGVLWMAENPESTDINDWTGTQVAIGVQLDSIAVGDFNFDGDLDVVVGDSVGSIYLYDNPGSADISTWPPATTLAVAPGSLADMNVGDLDEDGDLDILIATAVVGPAGFLSSVENPGTGASDISTWTVYNIAGSLATVNSLAIGDFDGDEDIDAVMGSTELDMYESDGTVDVSGWTYSTTAAPGDTYALGVADFDDDGDFDMISGDDSADITIWENPDSADITAWTSTQTGVALYNNVLALDVGDIDGDGDVDAAGATVSGLATNAVYTFNNPGSVDATTWSSSVVLDDGGDAGGVVLADPDMDGDLDIIFAGDGPEVDIFENTEVTMNLIESTATDPITNESGAQIDLTVSWTPAAAGTYSLLATVDDAQALTDMIRSNNRLTLNGINVAAQAVEEEESSHSSNDGGLAPRAEATATDLSAVGEINVVVGKGAQSLFSLGGASHIITVREVKASSVDLTVQSDPIDFSLDIGETKNLDLDADSVDDVTFKLNGITNGKADLTVTKAAGVVVAAQQESETSNNLIIVIVVIAGLIIGALLVVFGKKLKIFNR